MNFRMNKKIVLAISLLGLFAFGVFLFQAKSYVSFKGSSLDGMQSSEQPRVIYMRALKEKWVFDPAMIIVKEGERVILRIYNEDNYAHGFALPAFGINEVLLPEAETVIEFVAAQAGSFGLLCSVPCGEGHFHMTGKIIVEEP